MVIKLNKKRKNLISSNNTKLLRVNNYIIDILIYLFKTCFKIQETISEQTIPGIP